MAPPPTMDLRFTIKKEQGKYSIIKHPTTTKFSFLFSSLKKNQEQQNNNPCSSSVVDVTEDDRVCLHFSVGDPSCPQCDYQQKLTINNKNRKRSQHQQLQTLKNKKARINKEEDLSANSSLCFIIKKEQGKYSIIKKPTFSFLFSSSLKNNNPCSSSDVDVTEDDRVCLHFSVGDPSCPSCNYQQQQLTTNNNNNKKRKRDPQQQQTLMNKKPRINKWVWEEEEEEDLSVCLHLMLGSSSCMPTCCLHQTNNNIAATAAAADDHHDRWEMKKVLEQSDVSLHLCRLLISKNVAQKFVIPFLLGGAAEAAKSKEGVQLQVHDVDTDTLHSLVFKYWSSAKCHIFTKSWVEDFVHRRDLKKGDKIGLHWDQKKNRLDFSVLGRGAMPILD